MPKKDEFTPGEYVLLTTKEKQYSGVIMPSPDPQNIVLKLKTGYNIVINKKAVTAVKKEKIPVVAQEKHKLPVVQHKKELKTIAILHTGGTIASEIDYATGAVVARFTPEELIAKFPQLQEIANIRSRLIRNMFSEDMSFFHYNL